MFATSLACNSSLAGSNRSMGFWMLGAARKSAGEGSTGIRTRSSISRALCGAGKPIFLRQRQG